jgi:transposase-like protein
MGLKLEGAKLNQPGRISGRSDQTAEGTAMDLVGKPATRGAFSPEFKRDLVKKIVLADRTSGDRADERGIPPDVMRKWTLMVERAETITSSTAETLVPASRIHELERQIEDLKRRLGRQAITIQILKKKGIL